MIQSKVKNLKKGNIFATKGNPKKLYMCVRTRKPTETYYGYIIPYPFYGPNEVQIKQLKRNSLVYNFYPNFQSHYLEFDKDNKIFIYEKSEVMLMNLQS
jgi:hypothetical protein